MTSWTKELDEAAVLATKSGYWHVILFYLLCGLAAIPTSFLVFSQVFTNATPQHWCAPPPELEPLGLSDEEIKYLTTPDLGAEFAICSAHTIDLKSLYRILSDYVNERSEFVHDSKKLGLVNVQKSSPVVDDFQRPDQFSLVCDKEWLPRLCNTLFWVGSVFGNLFFGWMSDRYGRRPTILLMILLEVPLTIAASFPTNYWSYMALRVAGGLFFPALYQQPFILALELMPPKRRTYAGIVVSMLFASGMCILALIAFVIRDWFYLSLATSVPFVLLFSFYWLLPESPRWLVGRGRIADAENVLRNIAKKNGIVLKKGFLLDLHKNIKQKEEEADAAILLNINGHISGMYRKEYTDRRISKMLTYKPENFPVTEEGAEDSVEKIIAMDVAEVINKRTRLKSNSDREADVNEDVFKNESLMHSDSVHKYKQTGPFTKPPVSTLRRKSMQFVNSILSKEEDAENKMIDEQNSEGDCKASPLDIFRYPNIRKKFFILTFNWIAIGVVYNSLSYNSPNLGVDDYIAFFIGGAVELPSYILALHCMDRYGRRWVLCVFASIGGLACLSCILVPDSMPWVTVSLAMLGRFCTAASFGVFYVQIGELLPTVLRAQAMGAASFISGLGLLSCPYIVHLAKYSRALPLTIMGILSMMGGVASLFLPETLNQPLPQTLGDGEMFGKNFKILSFVRRRQSSDEC